MSFANRARKFVKTKTANVGKNYIRSIPCIRHSPKKNKNFFATASIDQSVRMFDASTMKEIWIARNHVGTVWSVDFSPDGSMVASGSNDFFSIITDADTGKMIKNMNCGSSINCVVFFPDGKHVVCALMDGTMQIWNIITEQCTAILDGHNGFIECCVVSTDPTNGSFIVSGDCGGVIKVWNCVTNTCTQSWKAHRIWVRCLRLSSSGTKILSCSKDKTAVLWNTKDGSVIRKFEGHTDDIQSCALSCDESAAFTIASDRTIKIWNTCTGECIQTIQVPYLAFLFSLSPDDSEIIVGHDDDCLSVLQRLPGPIICSVNVSSTPLSSFLSIDQKFIAIAVKEANQNKALIIEIETNIIIACIDFADENEIFLQNICVDFATKKVLSKRVALQKYAIRCLIVSRILMFSPDSRFKNRMKLSIWDVPDVFADAVAHVDLGMTFQLAKQIIQLSIDEEQFQIQNFGCLVSFEPELLSLSFQ